MMEDQVRIYSFGLFLPFIFPTYAFPSCFLIHTYKEYVEGILLHFIPYALTQNPHKTQPKPGMGILPCITIHSQFWGTLFYSINHTHPPARRGARPPCANRRMGLWHGEGLWEVLGPIAREPSANPPPFFSSIRKYMYRILHCVPIFYSQSLVHG